MLDAAPREPSRYCPRGKHRGWERIPLDRLTDGSGWDCPGIALDGSPCGYELRVSPLALAPGSGLREHLGRIVRETWVGWALEQPDPKPSWLEPWEELDEPGREVDRRIGEAVAVFAAEHCAQAVRAHMEAHGPKTPGSAWRRHLLTASRVAAGAFMTGDDKKRAAAKALASGDFVACDVPEVPGA